MTYQKPRMEFCSLLPMEYDFFCQGRMKIFHDFCTTKVHWNRNLNIFPGGLCSHLSIGVEIRLTHCFLKLFYLCQHSVRPTQLLTRTKSYLFWIYFLAVDWGISSLHALSNIIWEICMKKQYIFNHSFSSGLILLPPGKHKYIWCR